MTIVRKIVRVGNSTAIIVPNAFLEHIHCQLGDFVVIDDRAPDFLQITKALLPPHLRPNPQAELLPAKE